MKTKPLAALAILMATLFALAPSAFAGDPAAKNLKKAGRGVEKTVKQEGAVQIKALKDSLDSLLKDVAAEAATPVDALGEAVLAATEAAGAVSTAAFDGVTMVREDAVDDALGGAEGPVLLSTDFQAGGGGIWDDFIGRVHGHLSKTDDRLSKELWKFVGKLEKAVTKLGGEVDVHLQVRGHDTRIDAIQCPASLAANAGGEALSDSRVSQVLIEARIVEANDDVTSHLGVLGFGNSSLDLQWQTSAGAGPIGSVPMLPSGVALSTTTVGSPADGPYRVDVLDPMSGGRTDSVGGRRPSTGSASGLNDVLEQALKAMKQDGKFFGKVSGQIRGDYRKADKGTCKDYLSGALDAEQTLDQLFANQRAAVGGLRFWEQIVARSPIGFAESELISMGVADEDIPDDLAADAGGAFSKHLDKVGRRSAQRMASFQKIGDRSLSRILKKIAAAGQEAAVSIRSPRLVDVQGPTISTFQDAVIQIEVRPQITSAGIVTLEVAPDVVESTAYITGRTPAIDTSLVITQVSLFDGETVVLGGLQSSSGDNTFQEKIPLLGDLPLIGRLFKVKNTDEEDSDQLVIVTPMLVQDT